MIKHIVIHMGKNVKILLSFKVIFILLVLIIYMQSTTSKHKLIYIPIDLLYVTIEYY